MSYDDTTTDEAVLAVFVDASRSRNDREEAFREIVRRYERRVFAICARQLRRRSDAEEAAQDTFVNLARRADQFRGDSKLSTFIYRIAVNACRDLARKQARRPATPVEDIEQSQRDAGIHVDIEDEVAAHDTAAAVQDALNQLDEVSRTLIILCAIEGMSYPEAAVALDMPVGTIKSRVHRARAKLAELLADLHEDRDPPGTVAAPAPRASRGPRRPGGSRAPPDRPNP